MTIWQADFYLSSRLSAPQQAVWELVLCDRQGNLIFEATCSQKQVHLDWLLAQLSGISEMQPDRLQIFRPQCVDLFENVGKQLGISIETTRRTFPLKQLLRQRGESIDVKKPPPQPLPDRLWGEKWRFASLPAGEVVREFCDRPIPILDIPQDFTPEGLGLSSSLPIPGIIIEGGRQSMQLARWVQEIHPYCLHYITAEAGRSGGIVLEAGLCDRWIFQTFADPEVSLAAREYQKRQQHSQGLHFLLIQPDKISNNFTGYWLLMNEE
jgi:hypothetical protein